ncbi:MAG: preprotein translocase subunit SecE [Clostridiales bacterium]|nr:preprotein translocase subunit SecE [Clostridiales bacterium]
MAENKSSAEKANKKSWFKGLEAEFKKIIWPDRTTLTKRTSAVVIASIVLGAIITVIDVLVRSGIELLIK